MADKVELFVRRLRNLGNSNPNAAVRKNGMKIIRSREIVVEYEKVQTVQKRALTQVVRCERCGADADFVAVSEAVDLFNTPLDTLTAFIASHRCHVLTDAAGTIFVCIASLVGPLQAASGRRLALPAIGD